MRESRFESLFPIQSLLGDGVTGNTTHFDCVILGSNPSPPANDILAGRESVSRDVLFLFGYGVMVTHPIVNRQLQVRILLPEPLKGEIEENFVVV